MNLKWLFLLQQFLQAIATTTTTTTNNNNNKTFNYKKVITIVAFDRVRYLSQSLSALAATNGAIDYTILISIDGFDQPAHPIQPTESTEPDLSSPPFEGFNYSPSYHRHQSVINLVKQYQETVQLSHFPFQEMKIRLAKTNLGYRENKRQALEWGFDHSDYVIFLEDDIILSSDALQWFESHVTSQRIFTIPNLALVTCFGYSFPATLKENAAPERHLLDTALVHELGLLDIYHPHSWHTPWGWSTWRSVWDTLQLKNWSGNAIDLGENIKNQGLHEITPLVPRCDNIGLQGVNMAKDSKSPIHARLTLSSHFPTHRLSRCKYKFNEGPFTPIRMGLNEISYPPNSTIESLLELASPQLREVKKTASC
jgi:hypothetical protein